MTTFDEIDELDDCTDELDERVGDDEIQDDDWTTPDGCRFYSNGRLVLDATDMSDAQAQRAAGRIMLADNFFPNVWYVSDHGNVSIFTFES